MRGRIRVLVAESSRLHACLLTKALKSDPILDVIGFESGSTGLATALKAHRIDVLVINSNLEGQPARGLEVLRELHSLRLATRAVLLLEASSDEAVLQAFRAGARGLFGKSEPVEMLTRCVRCVAQGQIWADNHTLSVAVETLACMPTVRALNANGMEVLSRRELQVVRSLAEGLSNREIAARLELSPHTVKNYLFRIFEKLGVSSRVEVLFMTLNHAGAPAALTGAAEEFEKGDRPAKDETDLRREAAGNGSPAAQFALAELYSARRADSRDLVNAYMWYLIATEGACQARELITGLMTQDQIDEAQRNASLWLARQKRTSPHAGEPVRVKPPLATAPICGPKRAAS